VAVQEVAVPVGHVGVRVSDVVADPLLTEPMIILLVGDLASLPLAQGSLEASLLGRFRSLGSMS
jgi:hypothetical protein